MYTYIMQSQQFYKIGKTKNIKERLFTTGLYNPSITLIFLLKENIEKDLHEYFRDYHVGREWFKIPKRTINKILSANQEINLVNTIN